MPKRIIPTPVKTRFLSVVLMTKMMLKYKKVIDECFGFQPNLNLRQIVPTNDTWEIVNIIVNTSEQLIVSCLRSQRGNQGISDAVAHIAEVYMKYSHLCITITSVAEIDIERHLKMFQEKMAAAVCENLKPVVTPLFEFHKLDGCLVHHYIKLSLDP